LNSFDEAGIVARQGDHNPVEDISPNLLAHLQWQAEEIMSQYDLTALAADLAEHRIADRLTEELEFLGYLSSEDLQTAGAYFRVRSTELEERARGRLRRKGGR
jgi:hypothetical protein